MPPQWSTESYPPLLLSRNPGWNLCPHNGSTESYPLLLSHNPGWNLCPLQWKHRVLPTAVLSRFSRVRLCATP